MTDEMTSGGSGSITKITLGYCSAEKKVFLHATTLEGETFSMWLKMPLARKLSAHLSKHGFCSDSIDIDAREDSRQSLGHSKERPVQITPSSPVCEIQSIDVSLTPELTTLIFRISEPERHYSICMAKRDVESWLGGLASSIAEDAHLSDENQAFRSLGGQSHRVLH